MNELQIFENSEFGSVRTVYIDGKIYFVANDVAKALGYSVPKDAVTRHCKGALKRRYLTDGGEQEVKIVPEGDVYRLIIKSQLPSAERFERWVFEEVLPTIRQTGQYGKQRLPMTIPEQIQLLAKGSVDLETKIDDVKKDLEDFKNDMPILGIEESRISCAVKKKGVECLGGKESNAYKDRSLRGKLYSDLHMQLRREFGVGTYKAIKRNQTDTAVAIIQCYVPPLVLSEAIETINA